MTKEDAIKIIRKYECNKEHYDACEMIIKAVEQEPKKGHWVYLYTHLGCDACKCSECGVHNLFTINDLSRYNYCFGCGAKMESGVLVRESEVEEK